MVYLLIGRRKRGKTTLAYYMVRKSPRRLIFDPRQMVPEAPRSLRCFNERDFAEKGIPALVDGEIDQLAFCPLSDDLAGPFDVFARELKQWITEFPAVALGVMIDELGWIETPAGRDPKALRRALRDCEPDLVDVFITCHRPSDVPVNTRSIADYWLLFHCVQEHDLDVIRDRCNETVAIAVPQLDARAFVLYDDAQGKHMLYPSGESWFVPLRRRTTDEHSSAPLDELHGEALSKKPLDSRRLPFTQ